MKDIIFTPKRQKIEIKWFIACFCGAILMNVFSIIFYQTSWSEFYSQYLWIGIITCGLYAISVAIRVAVWIARYLLKRWF